MERSMNNKTIVNSFIIPTAIVITAGLVSFSAIIYAASLMGFDTSKLWPAHLRLVLVIYFISLFIIRQSYEAYKRLNKEIGWSLTRKKWALFGTLSGLMYVSLFYYIFRSIETPMYSFVYALIWFGMLCFSLGMQIRQDKKKAARHAAKS